MVGKVDDKKIVVVQALIIRDDSVLLVANRWSVGTVWSLPGGGCEAHETIEEALVRELNEETGLDVTMERIVSIHECELGPWMGVFVTCAASVAGGSLAPQDDEIAEAAFVDTSELKRRMTEDKISVPLLHVLKHPGGFHHFVTKAGETEAFCGCE